MVEMPNLTPTELEEALYGDIPEGYEVITEPVQGFKTRWQQEHWWIIRRLSDMSCWRVSQLRGLTENQDHEEPEIRGPVKEVTTTIEVQTWEMER